MSDEDGDRAMSTGGSDDGPVDPGASVATGDSLPEVLPAPETAVDASGARGVQVGDGTVQINIRSVVVGAEPGDGHTEPDRQERRDAGALAGRSPYPGMRPFQAADAPFFHGRQRLTHELAARVEDLYTTGGALFVVGASGAGKSSLLGAGLVPALGPGAQTRLGLMWPAGAQPVLVPGPRPVETLATCLANLTGLPAPQVRDDLMADPDGFDLLVRQALQVRTPQAATGTDDEGGNATQDEARPVGGDPAARRLVLVIDQFEEVFAPDVDEAERQVFVRALLSAAAPRVPEASRGPARPDADAAALVVVGLRADFFDRCLADPLLRRYLQDQLVLVGPMTAEEVRTAIEQPAEDAGFHLESGLVDVMLADLRPHPAPEGDQGTAGKPAHAAGGLPFLAHALRETCERRTTDGMLTIDSYRDAGGVQGSVAASAERLYTGLDDRRRQILRQIMLRLVTVTEDTPPTRRHLTRGELIPEHDPDRARTVEEVLDHLVAARLVTATTGWVEISHEVLLTGWPRLARWLGESTVDILLRHRLEETSRLWAEISEDPDLLYRGSQLAGVREWASTTTSLGAREQRFLDASTAAAEAAAVKQARARRRLLRLVAGLAVTTVLAVSATGIAVRQTGQARTREAQAQSRQYAAESLSAVNNLDARKRALQAWQAHPTAEARGALLSAQTRPTGGILGDGPGGTAVATDPHGTRVAVGYGDGRVELWDPFTFRRIGQPLDTGTTTRVGSMGFSDDGRLLATGVLQEVGATVWDTESGKRLRDLPGVGHVVWRPGNNHLLTLYLDTRAGSSEKMWTLGEWDPGTGRQLSRIRLRTTAVPYALVASPDGAHAAVSGFDGVTRVWRLSDGRLLTTIGTPNGVTNRGSSAAEAVFASDGTLVTNDAQGEVHVWAMPSGRHLRDLFSPHSITTGYLAADSRGTVCLTTSDIYNCWDVPHGVPMSVTKSTGRAGTQADIALSADGELVVVSGPGTVTRVVRGSTSWLRGPRSMIQASFDPTGNITASGDAEGTLRLWHPGDPSATTTAHYPGLIQDLDYSPDGALAVAVDDGAVHLRSPDGTDDTIINLDKDLYPGDVRFSPDGRLLAVTARVRLASDADDGARGSVIVWDVHRHRVRTRLDTRAQDPWAVAFSADGAHLIAATSQTTIGDKTTFQRTDLLRFWRTGDFSELADLEHEGGTVTSLAAGRNNTFAVARADGVVEIRHLPDGKVLRTLRHPFTVRQVAYSPDGRTLATSTTDEKVIRLWNAATGTELAQLAGHLDSEPNSLAFSPDGNRLVSTGSDGAVGVWQLNPDAAVAESCRALRAISGAAASSDTDEMSDADLSVLCPA